MTQGYFVCSVRRVHFLASATKRVWIMSMWGWTLIVVITRRIERLLASLKDMGKQAFDKRAISPANSRDQRPIVSIDFLALARTITD